MGDLWRLFYAALRLGDAVKWMCACVCVVWSPLSVSTAVKTPPSHCCEEWKRNSHCVCLCVSVCVCVVVHTSTRGPHRLHIPPCDSKMLPFAHIRCNLRVTGVYVYVYVYVYVCADAEMAEGTARGNAAVGSTDQKCVPCAVVVVAVVACRFVIL